MNPETVERVLEAAAALRYQPSPLARALRTNRTFAVGVAVPDLTNPVFPPVVRGLEDVLGAAGYTLILSNTDSDLLRERTVVQAMLSREVDGIVLLTSFLNDPIVEELVGQEVPLVLVGRVVEGAPVPSVTSDDVAGVGLAVEHLIGLGHRRIAYVGGPQNVSTGRRRHDGYVAALLRVGLDPNPALVAFAAAFDDVSGAKACEEILEWGEGFTALVAGSDAIALGCLDVLAAQGLAVPADVSLVGYGGTRMAAHVRPTLTTVQVHYYQMGRMGAELLLELIAGKHPQGEVRLDPVLVVGASTGRAG
jgi:LacI family transcriptional regulator